MLVSLIFRNFAHRNNKTLKIMAQTTIIINQSDIETIQPTSTCNEFAREVEGISIRFRQLTAPVIYRKQLKMYRRMAQFIDLHPTLSTILAATWATAWLFLTIIR